MKPKNWKLVEEVDVEVVNRQPNADESQDQQFIRFPPKRRIKQGSNYRFSSSDTSKHSHRDQMGQLWTKINSKLNQEQSSVSEVTF